MYIHFSNNINKKYVVICDLYCQSNTNFKENFFIAITKIFVTYIRKIILNYHWGNILQRFETHVIGKLLTDSMVDFHYVEAQAFDNSISQFLSTISSSQWEIAVQKASLDIPCARTRSYVAKDTVRL